MKDVKQIKDSKWKGEGRIRCPRLRNFGKCEDSTCPFCKRWPQEKPVTVENFGTKLKEDFRKSFHGGTTSDGIIIAFPPKIKNQISEWWIERIKTLLNRPLN